MKWLRITLVLISLGLAAGSLIGANPHNTLSANPRRFNFGAVPLGSNVPQTIEFTNSGSQSITISSYEVTGDLDFVLTGSGCQPGVSLPPGAACRIEVTYRPTHTGRATATVTVSESTLGTQVDVSLSGRGTSP